MGVKKLKYHDGHCTRNNVYLYIKIKAVKLLFDINNQIYDTLRFVVEGFFQTDMAISGFHSR